MEQNVFDLDLLAEKNGVEEDNGRMGPPPGAKNLPSSPQRPAAAHTTQKHYRWKHDELMIAVDAAKKVAAEGKPVFMKGGAMSWLLGAAVANMADVLETYQMGENVKPVSALPTGAPNPEGGIAFSVEQRDGKTYLSYECVGLDDPHHYDLDLLSKVVLPEIPDNAELYLKPSGYFLILMYCLKTWTSKCSSIYIYDMFTNSYVCGYARDAAKLGAEEPAAE